jgi:hypothetical protein
MRAAMREIREKWKVTNVQYLDNLLFLDKDAKDLERQTMEIAMFLQNLGWSINWKKSRTTPSQRFVFLGIEWDTREMNLQIEMKRNSVLRQQVKKWTQWTVRRKRVPVKQVAKLIGQLSQTRVQHSRASLYLARLNRMKTQAVNQIGWNGMLTLTPWVMTELVWWTEQLRINKPSAIRSNGQTVTLYTDTSPQGWGGWLEKADDIQTKQWVVHSKWKDIQQHSSNYHEAMAVYLSLKHFIQLKQVLRGQSILLRTDNTSVMFNVNKKRGALTLLHPLKLLMELMETKVMEMKAIHIQGITNVTGGSLSRLARSGDYAAEQ